MIEIDEANNWLQPCRDLGIIVLLGDATHPQTLRRARVQTACYLLAVCEDGGLNSEIAIHAEELCKNRRSSALTCSIHIVEPQLWTLLREREIGGIDSTCFRLEMFNVFDHGARRILQEYPLPGKPYPHLLIIGLGRLGQSLAARAAHAFQERQTGPEQRLQITIVDRAAHTKVDLLRLSYPHINHFCDFFPNDMEIHSPEFKEAAFLYGPDGKIAIDAIYICVDSHVLGLHAALAMLQHTRRASIPS